VIVSHPWNCGWIIQGIKKRSVLADAAKRGTQSGEVVEEDAMAALWQLEECGAG